MAPAHVSTLDSLIGLEETQSIIESNLEGKKILEIPSNQHDVFRKRTRRKGETS